MIKPNIDAMPLKGTPPTKSIPSATTPKSAAVEKSAGRISPHTKPILINIGKTSPLKSFNLSRRTCNSFASHRTKPTFAKSDVWSVSPIKGTFSQRRASLMSEPKMRVSTSPKTAKTSTTLAIRAKYL